MATKRREGKEAAQARMECWLYIGLEQGSGVREREREGGRGRLYEQFARLLTLLVVFGVDDDDVAFAG